MAYRKFLPAIGLLGFALATPASAADMPYSRPGPQVQEYFSNWYLRGDGGYRFNEVTVGQAFGRNYSTSALAGSGVFGVGVGYKWAWFRSDLTVDYGTQPQFSGDTLTQHINSKLSNVTTLLNAYFDLGSWWGVTPYVGGGVGYSYLKPGEISATNLPSPPPIFISNSGRWQPSWAATAGLSYAVTPMFVIDASYRYLNIGEGRSSFTAPVSEVRYGNWTAQEVRLGLRYLIP